MAAVIEGLNSLNYHFFKKKKKVLGHFITQKFLEHFHSPQYTLTSRISVPFPGKNQV